MSDRPRTIKTFASFAIVATILLFTACDALEGDVTPSDPTVKDNEVHLFANANGYIDLRSLFEVAGQVRLDISSSPLKGKLSEVGTALLRYTPNQDFRTGQDYFALSIFNASNQLLKRDTVVIIIEEDSTQLPCGIYPVDDAVTIATSPQASPVTVDVLGNDIICGDSTDIKVEIYHPDSSFPPYHGTATVENNHLVYSPSQTGVLSDTVIYKLSKISDNSVIGFGAVAINIVAVTCEHELQDDFYAIDMDSLINNDIDTLAFHIMNNDDICGDTAALTILEGPHHGVAVPQALTEKYWYIRYEINQPKPALLQDSLQYRICNPAGGCKTAKLKISLQ